MRILLIYNYYQQPGGEDAVFEQEAALLRDAGVTVETLTFTNESFDGTLVRTLRSGAKALYNTQSGKRLDEVISQFRPDLVHVHNLFYTASASVIRVARQRKVPVVMTLHNYRLVCVSGLLMREGRIPCETCLTRTVALTGIRHACFRESYLQSAQLSLTTLLHKLTGVWRSVNRFVVLTEFARQKILQSSLRLRPDQVVVKPNFVADLGVANVEHRQDFFLFIGRLSAEKGITVLLDAAQSRPFPLRMLGDGPLATEVIRAAATHPTIDYRGWQSRTAVIDALKTCRALIVPSVWYEGLPTVLLEAFAAGTPIICSDQENLNQIVTDGQTGLLFKTGDSDDLIRAVDQVDTQPELRGKLARHSRLEYARYSKEAAREAIIRLYTDTIQSAGGRTSAEWLPPDAPDQVAAQNPA